ncbi:aromatic acid exporter family protein [Kocuria sp.]|uniref:FUSC family protein n=1 Tax=Kocuria sp. TaxID=1871328 RepID=UPI0026DA9C70|nr:FUSC family protein [Kocuria sp.]MDO4919222.1 FUSC family protein [Kocuria sp.]
MAPTEADQPRSRLRRVRGLVARRARTGWTRMSAGFFQAVQMTVAAVVAYVIAERLLGHHGPIFAATAALVSLGYAKGGLRYRRVLEVSLGCTLGIIMGDTLIHLLGPGEWQAGVVLLASLLLARFLDNGGIFTTQMGLQSVLVVLLPPSQDGVFGRSLDAVVGCLCALLLAYVLPQDPRREPRQDLGVLITEFTQMLTDCSHAVADTDSRLAWHALVRGRQTQPLVDSVRTGLQGSWEIVHASPIHRRHRREIDELSESIRYLDLAVRNSRVFARRLASVLNRVTLADEAVTSLSEALSDLSDAVLSLGHALNEGHPQSRESYLRQTRNELISVARRLEPAAMGIRTMEGEALVLLLRPMVVDLLEATGVAHETATAHLPPLGHG